MSSRGRGRGGGSASGSSWFGRGSQGDGPSGQPQQKYNNLGRQGQGQGTTCGGPGGDPSPTTNRSHFSSATSSNCNSGGSRRGDTRSSASTSSSMSSAIIGGVGDICLESRNEFGWVKGPLVPPLPRGDGSGTSFHREIPVTINVVPTKVILPTSCFYQYDVDIRLQKMTSNESIGEHVSSVETNTISPPGKLWNKIMKGILPMISSQANTQVASDFSKALYSTEPLKMVKDQEDYMFNIKLRDIVPFNEASHDLANIKIKQSAIIKTNGDAQECFSNLKKFIQEGGTVPSNLVDIERVLNVALKTTPYMENISHGRGSFFPEEAEQEGSLLLGGGAVSWTGFSLIYTLGWKPYLNIDVAHLAFMDSGPVYDVITRFFTPPPRRPNNTIPQPEVLPRNVLSWKEIHFTRATEALLNVEIDYQAGGTRVRRKLKGLKRFPATECKFNVVIDGIERETNVAQHFRDTYNIQLQFPDTGLCLLLGKSSVVPAEICKIRPGQEYSKKLSDSQTSLMIRNTAKPPKERQRAVQNFIKNNLKSFKNDPVLEEFNIRVHEKLLNMKARVLDTPEIIYSNRLHAGDGDLGVVKPRREGTWEFPAKSGLQYFQPAHCGNQIKWAVTIFKKDRRTSLIQSNLQNFLEKLISLARQMGLNLGDPQQVMNTFLEIEVNDKGSIERHLAERKKADFRFVLCILPNTNPNDPAVYRPLKGLAEIQGPSENKGIQDKDHGILTQCLLGDKVNRAQTPVLENLINKLNAKLGGVNNVVNLEGIEVLRKCPVMIIGADVTHPTPDSKCPSIATVTATYDQSYQRYGMSCKAQKQADKGAAEVIPDLKDIVKAHIKKFVMTTGHKPRKLFYFRDGVGDGQFEEVLKVELMGIRSACTELSGVIFKKSKKDIALGEVSGTFEPKITFIAVQKRHKIRIYPRQPEIDGVGSGKNCPPGTVVDEQIVNPRTIDFYLLSHTGIQGTSKPSRYQVLWDDNEMKLDQLELMANSLCYGYARTDRSISYPVPTYYAHLACTRGRHYINTIPEREWDNLPELNDKIKRYPSITQDSPMHFI